VRAAFPGGGTGQSAARGDEAWLLVSGDNALWRNPKPSHPGILDLLADAAAVRAERLESGLHAPHAWVVANPLKATTAAAAEAEAEHLLRKVRALLYLLPALLIQIFKTRISSAASPTHPNL
jgi:hypothetical protein